MQIFLDRFAETLAKDEHAVMVLDGAGWHGAKALAVPPNITLVPLPPYSPQLNPMERVWLYLRERFLSQRILEGYEAIVDACCIAWNAIVERQPPWPVSDSLGGRFLASTYAVRLSVVLLRGCPAWVSPRLTVEVVGAPTTGSLPVNLSGGGRRR